MKQKRAELFHVGGLVLRDAARGDASGCGLRAR
jgi:hypothetical protein